MNSKSFKTFKVPSKKVVDKELDKQSRIFFNNEILAQFANSVSQKIIVLNSNREIVFSNQSFLDLLEIKDFRYILGYRVGEAVECIHSRINEGCGTSEFCRTCGAANAILASIAGTKTIKECRILTKNNIALDFRVIATPLTTEGQQFTIFSINDISNEKRRQSLERIFFHDILNSAGSIAGFTSLLQQTTDPDEIKYMAKVLNQSAENMIDEIQSQRQLNDAEQGDLKINSEDCNSESILNELLQIYSAHPLAVEKFVTIDGNSEELLINTDKVLLRRILSNMIKNGLEASSPHSTITLSSFKHKRRIRFTVHNPEYIEKEVQLQIFKRSYSTKGKGRGTGTYSMKLLGEKYLKGKVGFTSTPEKGTTFFIDL